MCVWGGFEVVGIMVGGVWVRGCCALGWEEENRFLVGGWRGYRAI